MLGRGNTDGVGKKGSKPKVADKRQANDNDSVGLVVTTEQESQKGGDTSGDVCQACRKCDTKAMVQCDECDMWSHFKCVGVTEDIEDYSWVCLKCQSAKQIQQPASTCGQKRQQKSTENVIRGQSIDQQQQQANTPNIPLVVVQAATDAQSSHSGNKSRSSKSSQSLLKLQLMKLEEERAFEEAEAAKFREYLKQKYRLLEQMSTRTETSYSDGGSRIGRWVNNVNDAFQDERNLEGVTEAFNPQGHSTTSIPVHRQELINPSSDHSRVHCLPNSTPVVGDRSPPAVGSESVACSLQHLSLAHSRNRCNVPTSHCDRSSFDHQCSKDDHQFEAMCNRSVPSRRQMLGQTSLCEDPCSLTRSHLAARQVVPKDLPTFSGSPEEWPIFLSMFNSSTTMCGYSNEENVIRLQKSLKGKAYEAVKSRLMHPSNVPGVMDTLRLLFGQPEAIVHSLIIKINAMPPVKEDKLEALVDLAVNVQNFCATVDACGLDDYMYNVSLLHQLINKLPPTIRLDWARYRQTLPRVNMATFGNWLYTLAEAASTLAIPSMIQETKMPKSEHRTTKKANMFLHTQTVVSERSSESSTTEDQKCPLCKGGCRSVAQCKKFLDSSRDSKWATVRELSLCRTCLQIHEGRCEAKQCGKDGCTYYHHELLHNAKKSQQTTPNTSQTDSNSVQGCNTHQSVSNTVLFRYLPVILRGENTSVKTYAFLDEGSAMTLLDQELADKLNLSGPIKPLGLRWTGGTERCESNSRVVDLYITGTHKKAQEYQLSGVRTVKELMLPYQSLDMQDMQRRHPHCRKLPIESYFNVRPQILIGSKHAAAGLVLKSKEGNLDEPIAVKTRLGWTVYGGCNDDETSNTGQYSFHVCETDAQLDDNLHQAVKDYFALDSLGIAKPVKELLSTENQRAISLLHSLTKFNGKQYETGLLWRYDTYRLPDNKEMALRRYYSLEKRMEKNVDLASTLQQKN